MALLLQELISCRHKISLFPRKIMIVMIYFVSSLITPFLPLVQAEATASSGTLNITIGTYNVLNARHTGGSWGNRPKAIASNLQKLNIDVAGLQEYTEDESNPIIKALGSSWDTSSLQDDSNTIGFVWNTTKVKSVSFESKKIFSLGTTCHQTGTPRLYIGQFQTNSGQTFYIANTHLSKGTVGTNNDVNHGKTCNQTRVNDMEKIYNILEEYTGPVFVVGDFAAWTSDKPNIDTPMKAAGFADARIGAVKKINSTYATTTDDYSTKASVVIDDRVIYRIGTASPTEYETLGCTSQSQCGSDHRPVRATFGAASSSSCAGDGVDNIDQFSAWELNLYTRECTCSETTGSITGTMSGDTNFKKITTYLASKGLNAIAIAGILGSWDVESPGLSVFRHEDGHGWEVGGYGLAQWTGDRRTNSGGTGVADNLKKDARTKEFFAEYYTSGFGGSPKEGGIPEGIPSEVNDAWLQVELDFMLEEFNQKQYNIGGGYTKLLKTAVSYVNDGDDLKTALNGAKTATDAALIFTAIFEKQGALAAIKDGSKEQFLTTVSGRITQAEKDLTDIQALIGSGASSGTCGSAQSAGSAVTIDGMTFPLQDVNKKYIGDGGGGKGSHLGNGTCANYWAYDLMMTGSSEAESAAKTVKVVAITDGTISSKVSIKEYSLGGQPYGWQLGLETSNGELFYYTHMLNEPIVKVGQAVKVGDLLTTGVKDVNGEHLHIDESPKGKGRNGPFAKGISRSSCSSASEGDFIELGPALKKLWEAME